MEEHQPVDEIAQKKYRQRKKYLYSSICEQLEFYFSDPNLSKDRYLSKLIAVDPYVDISIFLKFNKIRRLTENASDICKAISLSEILELSEDNTKIRRTTEICVKKNEDDCTIYVERLPADAEHNWLRNIFEKFGCVDYVSIPRFKHNNMMKGFAFVEFSTPEAAKQVLEYFDSIGCKLPTTMLPDKLASISTFESEPKKEETEHKVSNEVTINNEVSKRKKRKLSTDDEAEKLVVDKKIKETSQNVENQIGEEIKTPEEECGEKKKRKRKKHSKNLSNKLQQIGLQVLSKKEWKQLRNKYLNLQKQKMQTLKEHLWRSRCSNYNSENIPNDKNSSENNSNKIESAPSIKFTPDSIVHIIFPEPLTDVKQFKYEMRSQPGLEYIDLSTGENTGYLRFSENSHAKNFCESSFNAQKIILQGEEEQKYWKKINEHREKLFKKGMEKKQRGRDKLLRKAEKELGKHIRFENVE